MFEAIRQFAQRVRHHANMFLFAGAELCQQAALLVCQFVVLRFIPPDMMGIWQATALLNGYLMITRLGILNAMNREYPYYLGRSDQQNAMGVIQTGQSYALFNGAILAVVFLVIGLFQGEGLNEWRLAFFTMAATLPLTMYVSYLEGTYRAGNEFRSLAIQRLVQIPLMIATLLLPWVMGFNGFLLRTFILAAAAGGICHIYRPVKALPIFRKKYFKEMFSTGWRLYLWNYLTKEAKVFPQLALMVLGGTALLGLYTPVNWVITVIPGVAGSFGTYLYPKLTYSYARDNIHVGRVALRASLLIMLMMVLPALAGIVLIFYLVPLLLPKYVDAMPAMIVASVTSLIECISLSTMAFAAAKAWKPMTVYLTFSIAIRAIGAFGGYWLLSSDRLLGVSTGTLAASIVMIAVTWFTVRAARPAVIGQPVGVA